MNNYTKVTFKVAPVDEIATDVLAALLADQGFESFVPDEEGMVAYAPEGLFDDATVASTIENVPIEGYTITYTSELIEGEDWNAEWEKNYFEPIVVDDQCVIHSTFHKDVPAAKYDILIDPKMAFGTGYHQTTCHMIRAILASDMQGKSVLDMGCGTALLAILAKKCGAGKVVAIDIDEFAYENALENIELNRTPDIEVRLGGADALKESDSFDYVIANINRNILLADMQYYVARMNKGGAIYFSGFYESDLPMIKAEAERLGLSYVSHRMEKEWTAAKFEL